MDEILALSEALPPITRFFQGVKNLREILDAGVEERVSWLDEEVFPELPETDVANVDMLAERRRLRVLPRRESNQSSQFTMIRVGLQGMNSSPHQLRPVLGSGM